ncbi:MAG: DNA repair protein RadC [Firmicutes bacterium]|nr:DNA repair protein RadC [Bacillota bacterium]
MGLKQWPACERPREKLMRYGVKSLSNAELLALIVRTGTRGDTALSLAEAILAQEQGISSLGSMEPEDFRKIRGIGEATACTLTAAVELGKRIAAVPKRERISIDNSKQMADLFMEQMRFLEKELFQVVILNTKNEILAIENVSVGNLNSSIATPREVFHNAVRKSASAVILAHNHPSGNPEPSDADILLTDRMIEAGNILGIRVLDHIIIGDGIYVSMKEREYI